MSDQQATPAPTPAPAATPSPAPAAPQVHAGQLTPTQDTTPGVVNAQCPTPDQVQVDYEDGVDRSEITDHAIQVLKEVASRACVSSVVISSGARTAASQARIMYDNMHNDPQGVDKAMHLYGPAGRQVVQTYQQGTAQGLDKATIQSNMEQVISQNTDQFHHVLRSPNLSVFDVKPSSVHGQGAQDRLVHEARSDARVVQFYQPPNDPGLHFEIQNP